MAVLGLFFGFFQDFFQAVFWLFPGLLPGVAVWVSVGGLFVCVWVSVGGLLVCGVCACFAFFCVCLLITVRLCVVFGAVFGG